MPIYNDNKNSLVQDKPKEYCLETTVKAKDIPAYSLYFEVTDSYNGEFGFDNSRDEFEYKHDKTFLALNYELLMERNKRYYYVPWLTFPVNNQKKEIVLDIYPYPLEKTKIDPEVKDFITDSSSNLELISSNTEVFTANWSDTKKPNIKEKQLISKRQIILNHVGGVAKRIESLTILNAQKQILGKIRILFEQELEQTTLMFFGIKDGNKKVIFKPFDEITAASGFIKKRVKETFDRVNNNSFNQCRIALKHPTSTIDYFDKNDKPLLFSDFTISEDERIKDYDKKLIQKRIEANILTKIKYIRIGKNQTKHALSSLMILVFWPYSTTNVEANTEGFSKIASNVAIIKSSSRYNDRIWAHEIGHSLGLAHTFSQNLSDKLLNTSNAIRFTLGIEPKFSNLDFCFFIKDLNNDDITNLISKHLLKTYPKNSYAEKFVIFTFVRTFFDIHVFSKYKTKNIMDYVTSPSEHNDSFYKYQWDVLRTAIIKNNKSLIKN